MTGRELEDLGRRRYVEQDYDGAIDAYERAYAAYREDRNNLGAVRVASELGWLYGGYRGDGAVMQGWTARAQTLIADTEEGPAHGWVRLHKGMFERDRETRDAHLRAAVDNARRFADRDLEFFALAQLGSSLVHADRTEEGMVLLDEALAAVLGGEVKDVLTIETIFCQLFSACEHARDVARADQWIRIGEELAERRNSPAVAAWCRTHYGGILTAAGRWSEAESQLAEAARIWSGSFPIMRAGALVRMADLRVRQGRLEEAETLLEGYELHAEAAWPVAAIHLARGEAALAVHAIEQALEVITGAAAAPLLALLVDAHLARGAVDEAAAAADTLATVAAAHGGDYLKATAALARGRLCLAIGTDDTLGCLREALAGFAQAQLPMELASARLELARALETRSPEVAVAEATAALEGFERLAAARDADAAAALLRALGVARPGPRGGGTLTRRETQVLELVGEGLSNPQIADRLFISRKTVEHHVGRILAKLGLRSRAEAAAHAARGTGEKISP